MRQWGGVGWGEGPSLGVGTLPDATGIVGKPRARRSKEILSGQTRSERAEVSIRWRRGDDHDDEFN